MTKTRKDGLYLLMLGMVVFLFFGVVLEVAAPVSTADFRIVYYSTRCFLEHHDPYQEQELRRVYSTEGGESPQDTPVTRKTETQLIYFPTVFSVMAPFAMLPFGPSHVLWLILTAASLCVSSFLMWQVGADYAPVLSGCLIGFAVANCPLFLAIAGPGGIAVGFCIVAVWCFVKDRFVVAGVFCLAISLMLKPHDSGLVWLYFLLNGGAFRKRAIQTLLVLIALTLPAVLWLSHIAPNWISELHANLVANSAHGSLSDPGISSSAGHGIGMIISLQTIFSFFHDDPAFYNLAAYTVCGALLLVWMFRTIRLQTPQSSAWFALAPIAALSMLPVYHRLDDAKLLLLAIPACAMLWKRGGSKAWAAASTTAGGLFFTAAFAWLAFFILLKHIRLPNSEYGNYLLFAAQILPAPTMLLNVGSFFLWVYLRHTDDQLHEMEVSA